MSKNFKTLKQYILEGLLDVKSPEENKEELSSKEEDPKKDDSSTDNKAEKFTIGSDKETLTFYETIFELLAQKYKDIKFNGPFSVDLSSQIGPDNARTLKLESYPEVCWKFNINSVSLAIVGLTSQIRLEHYFTENSVRWPVFTLLLFDSSNNEWVEQETLEARVDTVKLLIEKYKN